MAIFSVKAIEANPDMLAQKEFLAKDTGKLKKPLRVPKSQVLEISKKKGSKKSQSFP